MFLRGHPKPAIQVTHDFNAAFSRKTPVPITCETYQERIEEGLAHGRNGKAVWQDLLSEHGFTGSYQAVKRFVQKLRGPRRPEPAGIILTAPGQFKARIVVSSSISGVSFFGIIQCGPFKAVPVLLNPHNEAGLTHATIGRNFSDFATPLAPAFAVDEACR